MFIQQGDVTLIEVDEIPEGKRVAPNEHGYVLAEGEVTGHRHRIVSTKSVTMTKTADGHIYLEVKEAVPLIHEEHDTVIVLPKKYRVGKIIERDHFSRITREIVD